MKPRLRLALMIVVALGILIALLFVWLSSRPPAAAALGGFSESGVQVDLSVEPRSDATCVLAARFTPLLEHYHVYSKDLPPDGVDGVGRPTRLDIISGLTAVGDLTADATTSDLKTEGIPQVLPVYPDGPVTLRLPVSGAGDGSAQVRISYMACSTINCLPPAARTLDIKLGQCQTH
jgi:hypothetical protein